MGEPKIRVFAELLIDCEEDRVVRAVLPPVSNFVVVYQQIENYILARGSRRERCSCIPRSPSRPPGSASRLGGLVGALLALSGVGVLQTTISSYLRAMLSSTSIDSQPA